MALKLPVLAPVCEKGLKSQHLLYPACTLFRSFQAD